MDLYKTANIRFGKIASSEYEMDEQFQNLLIFGSKNWKNSINLLISKISKF